MTWVPIFDATGTGFPTDPAACWADGFRAIAGYVNQGSWKSFTSTMTAKWLTDAHPFGFAPMYEVTGTEPVTNPASGSAHALAARKGARALGVPDDVAIAYAMDTNVTMTQVKGPIAKYFELVGKYDSCLPIGYIENDGAAWLTSQGLIVGGFIPAAYGWNNPAVLVTPANADASAIWTQEHNGRALHGGTVDVGHIRTSAPIWWPSSSAGSAPITGDEMTPAEMDALVAKVWTYKPGWTGLLDETPLGMLADLRVVRDQLVAGAHTLDEIAATTAAAVVAALPPSSGTVDVDALATAVADKLAARLES